MANTRDVRRFSVNVTRWGDDAKERGDRMTRAIVLGIYRDVILRTPVDTGRARSNWFLSINAPARGTVETADEGASKGAQSGRSASMVSSADSALKHGMDHAQTVYITNNLPYIKNLDDGSSQQNREGIVGPALDKARLRIGALDEI